MTAGCRPLWVVCALFVSGLVSAPAHGQSFRWPPDYPPAGPEYARVTITNQSNATVSFRAQWPGEGFQRKVLAPGQRVTLETSFPHFTPNPVLTVTYRPRAWRRHRDVVSLPSGHVDPATDNPGRVYDFYRERSNVGPIVNLVAR